MTFHSREWRRPISSLLGGLALCCYTTGLAASSPLQVLDANDETGSCTAIVVKDAPLVHTTQVLPVDSSGKVRGGTDVQVQTRQLVTDLGALLKANGSDIGQTVKLNIYLADAKTLPQVREALAAAFKGPVKPATCFVVGELPVHGALVALDAIAAAQKATASPAPSIDQGIRRAATLPAGPKIYVSGMADTNDLPMATTRTLEKLVAAIGHLGLNKKDIVQLKAFLQPMSQAAKVRRRVADFFQDNAPPLVLVEWISPAPNPPIEIELIAAGKSESETNSASYLTPPGTTSTKVFSRVVRVNHGDLIYFSGLYGQSSKDPGEQIREIFRSIDSVLKRTGSDFDHLVKATYYVSDEEASTKLNEVRPEFFNPARPPAASKAKVQGTGFSGKPIVLDMITVTR